MNHIDHSDHGEQRCLLEAAQAGDEGALGRLLAPHWRGLRLLCALMLGDPDAADRALVETVLTARRDVEAVEVVASVRMWIHRIAVDVCCRAAVDGAIEDDQPPERHDRGVRSQ